MPILVAFIALSLVLGFIFRHSLIRPRSHGFYRFFAMEAVLGLLLINGPFWFVDRFAPHQLASWAILLISLAFLIQGSWLLHRHGKANTDTRHDPALLGFEKTQVLVTTGIFAYIRHPLYSSLMLFAWGVYCKRPDMLLVIWPALATGFLILTAKTEEHECLQFFGDPYREYMARTRLFIPGVF